MKKIKLIVILFLNIVLLQSCFKNTISDNNSKLEKPNKLYELIKSNRLVKKENNISDIKVIKDNNNNIAFLLMKEKEYYTKMFIVKFEKKDFVKLNDLNDFKGKIEVSNQNISITTLNDKYFFTVDENELKNDNKSFYAIGISEHSGQFEILHNKNQILNIDDVLINHLVSDMPLARAMKYATDCTSGGAGASECSIDEWTQNGCSVKCRSGYYACCNSSTVRCFCVKEEK